MSSASQSSDPSPSEDDPFRPPQADPGPAPDEAGLAEDRTSTRFGLWKLTRSVFGAALGRPAALLLCGLLLFTAVMVRGVASDYFLPLPPIDFEALRQNLMQRPIPRMPDPLHPLDRAARSVFLSALDFLVGAWLVYGMTRYWLTAASLGQARWGALVSDARRFSAAAGVNAFSWAVLGAAQFMGSLPFLYDIRMEPLQRLSWFFFWTLAMLFLSATTAAATAAAVAEGGFFRALRRSFLLALPNLFPIAAFLFCLWSTPLAAAGIAHAAADDLGIYCFQGVAALGTTTNQLFTLLVGVQVYLLASSPSPTDAEEHPSVSADDDVPSP